MDPFTIPMYNPGVECYLNSIIQCLANNKDFVEKILLNINDIKESDETRSILYYFALMIAKNAGDDEIMESFETLRRLFGNAFFRLASESDRGFDKHEQQDVHEFLMKIIDEFETTLDSIFISQENQCMARNFKTILNITITCENGCRSVSQDLNIGFPLPINNANISNIKAAIDIYLQQEYFSSQQLYNCVPCGALMNAVKRKQIFKLPTTLILTLKRFDNYGNKIPSYVNITERLDLDEIVNYDGVMPYSTQNKIKYRLKSVCLHIGNTTRAGHYIGNI